MKPFDRTLGDAGNIVFLEHVNVRVPDQRLATVFYVMGLGLTRDPFMMPGVENMWVNVGQSQIHMPTGQPMVVRGVIHLVLPDLNGLRARLGAVQGLLSGTKFSCHDDGEQLRLTCPWGNRYVCRAARHAPGELPLGLEAVAFDVPPGTAPGIVNFYTSVFNTPGHVQTRNGHAVAHIPVGPSQWLMFSETPDPPAHYDHHHIQIYISQFSDTHRKLRAHGLISQEDTVHQYRFQDIIDLDSGAVLHQIEHEIRSLKHPLYRRPLLNRNPDQRVAHYVPGMDALHLPGL